MFSHTHKGQEYNMELLSKFLNPSLSHTGGPDLTRPRLIDYELLTDETGKRTVGFGWFAGGAYCIVSLLSLILKLVFIFTVAGALESLSALAHALLERGIASPFLVSANPS